VVIAIVAVLIAMLLADVQAAREAARPIQRTSNRNQRGLALANYETAVGSCPTAEQWKFVPSVSFDPGAGPLIALLPYFERTTLFSAFHFSLAVFKDVHMTIAAFRLTDDGDAHVPPRGRHYFHTWGRVQDWRVSGDEVQQRWGRD
jgi:type II secretory pathway pseudopilin PulG